MTKQTKEKIIKSWLGFVSGKVDFYSDKNYYNGVFKADLFRSRKEAKECYQDVRKIEIKILCPKNKFKN